MINRLGPAAHDNETLTTTTPPTHHQHEQQQQLQVVKPAMAKVLANKKAAKFLLKE